MSGIATRRIVAAVTDETIVRDENAGERQSNALRLMDCLVASWADPESTVSAPIAHRDPRPALVGRSLLNLDPESCRYRVRKRLHQD